MINIDKVNPTGDEYAELERALISAGSAMRLPAVPPISVRVLEQLEAESTKKKYWGRLSPVSRRFAYAALATIALVASFLLALPDARDALAQLFGLRTVRVILSTPTPALINKAIQSVGAPASPAPIPRSTRNSSVSPSPTTGVQSQCCETTLDAARSRTRYKLLLPPGESPSRVYLQQVASLGDAQQVILVFGNPESPEKIIYEATGYLYGKFVGQGTILKETSVNGQPALWLSGAPHLLVYLDEKGEPEMSTQRPVGSNTLAWEQGDLTLRLESDLSEQAAVRFAESLK